MMNKVPYTFFDYIRSFIGDKPKRELTASEKRMQDKLIEDMKELAASKVAPTFFTKPIPPPVKVGNLPMTYGSYTKMDVLKNRSSGPPYALSASWASTPIDPAKVYPKSASYAVNPNIKIDFSKTGGVVGNFSSDIDWSNISLSGFIGGVPSNEAKLTVRCFLGTPKVSQSSVSFNSSSLARAVWLNNNLDVVNAALARFNEKAREAFGAGNTCFKVVSGDNTHKDEVEIGFEYLMYEELAIKACIGHKVKHEGMNPIKVIGDVAATCEFYVVGEMEVDEEEGKIELLEIQEFKYLNRFHGIDDTLIKL